MLWILFFVGFAAANLGCDRGSKSSKSYGVSQQAVIPHKVSTIKSHAEPARHIVLPDPRVVIKPGRVVYEKDNHDDHTSHHGGHNSHRGKHNSHHGHGHHHRGHNRSGGYRVIERHEPVYKVKTKVAAPVYILPKHGPVVSNKGYYTDPCYC